MASNKDKGFSGYASQDRCPTAADQRRASGDWDAVQDDPASDDACQLGPDEDAAQDAGGWELDEDTGFEASQVGQRGAPGPKPKRRRR